MNKNTKHVLIDRPLVEQYQKDGFIIVEDVFTPDEVGALLEAVEHGDRVAKSTVSLQDASHTRSRRLHSPSVRRQRHNRSGLG